MKKIIKIILLLILIIISYLIVLLYLNNKNQNYLDSIPKIIKENYNIEEEISYYNIHGNYYILTTDTKIIVLNKEYEEVLNDKIAILAPNENNYNLIYKNNKLMYEETILKKDKLTYKYYDATTNEIIKETNMKEEVR